MGPRGAPRDISTLSFTHLCTFPPIYVLILAVCSLLHPYPHLLCGHTCTSLAGAIHLTAHFHRLCTFPSLFQSFKCLFFVLLAGYYPNRWRPLIDEAPTVSGKHRLLPEGKTPAVIGKHQLPPGNHRLLPDNTNCYGKTQSVTGKATAQMLPGHQRLPGNPHGGTQIVTGKTQIVVGERKLLLATSVLFLPYFVLLHPYFHLLYRHLSTSAAGVIDLTTQFHRLYAFPSIFQSYKWSFLYFSSRCYPYTHPFLSSLLF